jgi:signal transduction histidine kinase
MLCLDGNHPNAFQSIFSDKRRMLQILLNFISNSLKFTQKGGYILVRLRVLEEQVIDSKEDTKIKDKPIKKSSSMKIFLTTSLDLQRTDV